MNNCLPPIFFGHRHGKHVAVDQLDFGEESTEVLSCFFANLVQHQGEFILDNCIAATNPLALVVGAFVSEPALPYMLRLTQSRFPAGLRDLHPVADEADIKPITAGAVEFLKTII